MDSMINGMNLGVDSFILNPVLTSQSHELKNPCHSYYGQISRQGGS